MLLRKPGGGRELEEAGRGGDRGGRRGGNRAGPGAPAPPRLRSRPEERPKTMNRDLLPPHKYYRPSRARELRRRATQLEWWARRGAGILTSSVPLVLAAPVAAVLRMDGWSFATEALVVAVLVSCGPLLCIYPECAEL